MIDINRRKKLAYLIQQLSTGKISNDEFENSLVKDVTFGCLPEQFSRSEKCKTDDAIFSPALEYSWYLYNDHFCHKLDGKYQLSAQQMKDVLRLILFLHSNLEYEWADSEMKNPKSNFSYIGFLKSIFTLGQNSQIINLNGEENPETIKMADDYEYWPFRSKADFEQQLKEQSFLNEATKN